MDVYSNYHEAIIGLHQKGYCEDFVLFGDELFWIQEKKFIKHNDFSILECHSFGHPNGQIDDLVIFGVASPCQSVKGILMNHYTYTSRSPGIIVSKMNKIKYA